MDIESNDNVIEVQMCPHCYSDMDTRATYCPHCGRAIKWASAAFRVGTWFLALGLLAGVGALFMGESLFVVPALVIAGIGALMRILS